MLLCQFTLRLVQKSMELVGENKILYLNFREKVGRKDKQILSSEGLFKLLKRTTEFVLKDKGTRDKTTKI